MGLWRNRDLVLLQGGQLLSTLGTQCSSIAYPLLVLAVTRSAAAAGLVSFARTAPAPLLGIPAGVAADRYDRRTLMIVADGVRVAAIGGLAAAVITGSVRLWQIAFAAAVEGAGSALFSACQPGALRAVVSAEQLPAAAAAQTGRQAAVRLGGPPLGGALYGLARPLPFVVDACSYVFSSLSLLAMRSRFQQARPAVDASWRVRVAEGMNFLWGNRFLRVAAMLYGLTNLLGPGLLLATVVIGRRQGLSGAAIGGLVAAFGVALLAGSLLSGRVRGALPLRGVMLLELWAWPACIAFVLWPNVYVLVAGLIVPALAIPATDSVVNSYRIGLTPDRLLGRVESVRSTISLSIAPIGPLAAGFLLASLPERVAVGVFVAIALGLATWGTLDPAIQRPPPLRPGSVEG